MAMKEPTSVEDFETEEELEEEETPELVGLETAPDDFETISEDVKAYYDQRSSGAIIWIPRGIRLMDNRQSPERSTALILGELRREALLQENAREEAVDGEERPKAKLRKFPAGTSIGVWAKPGMRDLRKFGGQEVWMQASGTRKLPGREKPMALFEIKRKKGSTPAVPYELVADTRETSIAEPAMTEHPPWWLEVLPDGGLDAATEAVAAKAAELEDKRNRRSKRAATPAS